MKLVYIAGPYSAPTPWQRQEHIHAAWRAAVEVSLNTHKIFPVCPHSSMAHGESGHDYDYMISGTLELMLRCDAVLIVPGSDWFRSKGTTGEIATAMAQRIPVFFSHEDLLAWLDTEDV